MLHDAKVMISFTLLDSCNRSVRKVLFRQDRQRQVGRWVLRSIDASKCSSEGNETDTEVVVDYRIKLTNRGVIRLEI